MPSVSPKQKQMMAAIAHGWQPAHPRHTLPSVGVAREYFKADQGRKTQAVPQVKPAFMKPRYG